MVNDRQRERRWARKRAAGLAWACLLSLAVGCAHRAGQGPRSGVSGSIPALQGGETTPSRRLYRVRYQGPEGSGTMRLNVLTAAADLYQVRATDPFGRNLWSLELREGRVRFVDHRRREHCETGREVRIPEVALTPLPIDRLPDLLEGRIPATPREGSGTEPFDPEDFRDGTGRRWTARLSGASAEAWTLWDAAEPLLWWQRQPRGGVLSHRAGSQFRWRRAVSEPLNGAIDPLEAPPAYSPVDCSGLVAAESSTSRARNSARSGREASQCMMP